MDSVFGIRMISSSTYVSFNDPTKDPYASYLEDRIHKSKLSLDQKDLLKQVSSMALEQAETTEDKAKMVRTITSVIALMESVSKTAEYDNDNSRPTIADYINDLRASRDQKDQSAQDVLDAFMKELEDYVNGVNQAEQAADSKQSYDSSQGLGWNFEEFF